MKLIARLMSHGFAIALVLLLAIGFMYRGELFPEWELPEFLALDSAKYPAADQPAGRIEPAPIRHDAMKQATATGGQAAAEMKAGSAAVSDTVPAVAEASVPAAATMAAREPVDAGATAMGKPTVAEAMPRASLPLQMNRLRVKQPLPSAHLPHMMRVPVERASQPLLKRLPRASLPLQMNRLTAKQPLLLPGAHLPQRLRVRLHRSSLPRLMRLNTLSKPGRGCQRQ